jgi:SH3-like domain-containing protein
VVVDLEACEEGWCEVDADGYSGWLPKAEVWGVDRDEIFD